MKQEGAGNVFTTYKPYGFEWLRHALLVAERRQPDKSGRRSDVTYACDDVAKAEGVPFSTVYKHWQKAKKLGLVQE